MEWIKFYFSRVFAMLTCVKVTWTNIVVPFICIFTLDTISAAPLRRNDPDSYSNYNTRLEPGFDLTQEDMIKFHIWPKGIIPYYIDDFSFDKVLRDRIRVFLDGVNRLTDLHFMEIPRPPEDEEKRWVLFLNRKGLLGCADHSFKNFTNEGVQRVVLGYHCMNSDENLAELVLSLVGVPPQHNAPDRDANVIIMKDNIIPDKLHLFEKLKDNEWLFHNLTYDFESAGHYGPYKHTSNGKITIRRILNDHYFINVFGPLTPEPKDKGFSSQDILKISMLYNYILRNRETPVPECSKLFAPGSKLHSKLSKDMNLKIEPRQKPSRYLGESKKEEVNNKQENHFEENNNDEQMTDDDERNDDKEMNSKNEINEKNNSKNDNKDKENDENDYGNNEIEKPKLNNYLNNTNKDDKYCKDKGNIDHNNSEAEENGNKINADNNISGDNDKIQNNNSKKEENDDDDGDKSEDKNIEIDNESKKSDREGNKSNENEELTENVTTSDSIVNTTRTRNNTRKPLAYKKPNVLVHKLLTQSDYESSDERKNKYIHEKNL